jgi:hypothetical protein
VRLVENLRASAKELWNDQQRTSNEPLVREAGLMSGPRYSILPFLGLSILGPNAQSLVLLLRKARRLEALVVRFRDDITLMCESTYIVSCLLVNTSALPHGVQKYTQCPMIRLLPGCHLLYRMALGCKYICSSKRPTRFSIQSEWAQWPWNQSNHERFYYNTKNNHSGQVRNPRLEED